MGKDPNYDRYAGITSLSGDPLNPGKPRPFRVDEDGNAIYLDARRGGTKLAEEEKSQQRAQAGILDWSELDRGVQDRLSLLSAEGAEPLVPLRSLPNLGGGERQKLAVGWKTIGGIDYHVLSANTYDPARSNGKTVMPNADVIAAMTADMRQTAVTDKGPEKATRIVRLPWDFSAKPADGPAGERNLSLTNPKAEMYYSVPAFDTKAKSIGNADTLRLGAVPRTVAFGHGHRDGISDGMIDEWDPGNDLHGDVESLRGDNPLPMATISEGRTGWHQLDNGRVQFMYPVGSYSAEQEDAEDRMRERIQENLDRQQSLFQRKIP
jgi:hypothetical protein